MDARKKDPFLQPFVTIASLTITVSWFRTCVPLDSTDSNYQSCIREFHDLRCSLIPVGKRNNT